ncbi:hypothetical protein ACHWQZ_G002465 [Mnemiopsis leidyi]
MCSLKLLIFVHFLSVVTSHSFLKATPELGNEVRTVLRKLISDSKLSARELKLRSSLLLRAESAVRRQNSNADRQFNMAINKFSIMTTQEKSLYLGLTNITMEGLEDEQSPYLYPNVGTPAEFHHREHGHVTAVKDQQSCGSCWAFAGVGAFEGSYSTATGVLKSFSEKEALDCSYPTEKDGCRGGWYTAVLRYVQDSGRLAALRDIPYFPAADLCSRWDGKENGIKNADYIGYYTASSGSLQRILTMYTPAAAFTVEDDFFAYKDGVYNGCESPKSVNHGVIIVGYSPSYWEVKNSWGKDWGEEGYVKFSRSRDNVCQLTSRVMYPVVIGRDRGEKDQPDILPDEDLKNVALNKLVISSDGLAVVEATDGNPETCTSTRESANPYFKLDLKNKVKVQRVEVLSRDSESLIGSKVHIGNRGDFMDKRVGVIEEVHDGKAEINLEQSVEGSKLYLEYYSGGRVRKLTLCEIRILAGADTDDRDNGCPTGTVKCSDGICRHSHMC